MLIITSIFIFIIAVVFRLLDNSAGLLISNGISVSPFYLAPEVIRAEMKKIKDERLKRKLKRTLLFQKLHKLFTLAAIVIFIAGVVLEIYEPELIYLF